MAQEQRLLLPAAAESNNGNVPRDRNPAQIDLDSYADSLVRVITDQELPVPSMVGIIARYGSRKHVMLDKFMRKLKCNEKACGVTCPSIASHFVPERITWVYQEICGEISFFTYMLLLKILFMIVNVGAVFGMLYAFVELDTTEPTDSPILSSNDTNDTDQETGYIFGNVENRVTVPIMIALIVFGLALLYGVFICVNNVIRSACTNAASIEDMMKHFKIIILMLLCETPRNKLIPTDSIQIIPVHFNPWVYEGTDNLWACIVEQLFNRTEEMFGYWKTRLYRQTQRALVHEHDTEHVTRRGRDNCGTDDGNGTQDGRADGEAIELDEYVVRDTCATDCENGTQDNNGDDVDPATQENQGNINVKPPAKVRVESLRGRRFRLPYFCATFLVLTIIITSVSVMVIVAVYIDSTELDDIYAYLLQAVGGGVLGVTVLTQLKTIVGFIQNLFVSQSGRIRRLVNRHSKSPSTTESLGFMYQIKSEIRITIGFIQAMEQYYGHRFRILIIIEKLDRCKEEKIRDVFEALQLLMSDHRDPIVSIINIDPIPISRALSDGGKNGHVELKRHLNLRFCMPEVKPCVIAAALEEIERKGLNNLKIVGRLDVPMRVQTSHCCLTTTEFPVNRTEECRQFWAKSSKLCGGGGCCTPLRMRMTLLAVSEVKKNADLLDSSHKGVSYLYHSVRMSIACWTSHLKLMNKEVKQHLEDHSDEYEPLRQSVYLSCIELAQWLIIAERWPYRISWLYYSIEDKPSVDSTTDQGRSLLDHYLSIKKDMYTITDWKTYIELDGEETEFLTALDRFNTLTPQIALIFGPYTVNIDRGIKQAIIHSVNLNGQLKTLNLDTTSES